MKLDPGELRKYANRDWGAPERLAREARARLPVEQKVAIAVDLYESMKRTRPTWPDDSTRQADLKNHLRLRALLDRARHVGAR